MEQAKNNLKKEVEEKTKNLTETNLQLEKTELISNLGGWSIDVKTMDTYLSNGVRKIYEIESDRVLPIEEGINFYIPEHRPVIEKAIQECMQLGKPYQHELQLITAKGKKLWVRTGGSTEIENDSIVKITGFIQDITKQKNSELELQSAYQQLQANEQQLRASNQQLAASEQQLRATNQQLQASEQQLRSSNQQLQASEQQLRATNQQLAASERELILAKERAEKSEERMRLVIKGSNDAPWDWDLIENELYYSPQWWQQIGYEPNELKPNPDLWESLMCPDDKEQVDNIFGIALKTGQESYAVEFRLLHKKGYYVPVLSRGFITYDENNKPIRVSGTNLDLSAQKKAEQELKIAKEKAEESEERIKIQNHEVLFNNERLESLLKVSQFQTDSVQELLDFALTQGVELTRSKIGYIYFYSEEKKQFILNTWSKEVMKECAVMNPQTVYNLDDTGCWGEAVRQRKPIILNDYQADDPLKKGTPAGHVKLEKFLTIPVIIDNKIVAVAGVANKSTDYDQSDVRQLTLLMDSVWKMSERLVLVKDLQTAKEKAEKNENKLTTLLGNLPGLVYSSNSKWETDFINGSLNISGYTDEDFLTKRINWMNLIHEDDRQMVFEQSAILQKKKTSIIQEYRIIDKDNKVKHVSDYKTSSFSIDNKFVGVEGVVFDVSEKNKQKEELILAKEKAEESDRLKSAFLANMSHEIRTPMNGILGFTQLLLEPDLSSEEKEEYINLVQKSGQRMLNTVNDIIEISKIEAGLVNLIEKETDINDRVEELTDFFRLEAEKKGLSLNLEMLLPLEYKKVLTDQNKLDSILTNLIKNAIKYTDTGTINVGCRQKGTEVEFYVKDTGIGIPAHRQKAVFNRFEQADIADTKVFEGSGLGLAIVKSYV
ncbi:MAG: PAS domain-containing protein, partial [Desulfobulbaceae bacterium]|nr:PAS domain-containing protein [Desulfobulbaceae bacterium]